VPVARVLDHERRYWRRTLPRFGLTAADGDLAEVVVATATLFSAPTEAQARALVAATGAFAEVSPRTLTQFLRWAASPYPGTSWLNPLRPDRLGEDQAAALASAQPAAVIGPFAVAGEEQVEQAMSVVGRALPRHEALSDTLVDLLATDPRRILPVGMAVAPRLDDPRPLAKAMMATIRAADDPAVTETVLNALPDSSLALADLAVMASALTLDNAEQHFRVNPGARSPPATPRRTAPSSPPRSTTCRSDSTGREGRRRVLPRSPKRSRSCTAWPSNIPTRTCPTSPPLRAC
jgi:hypothetical protein